MFSVEYFNRAVIITAYNIRKINFRYQVNLKNLIVQALKKPCNKIILNLVGVRQIDPCAFEMLKQMNQVVTNAGLRLCMLNLDDEVIRQIKEGAPEILSCLSEPTKVDEYIESLAF